MMAESGLTSLVIEYCLWSLPVMMKCLLQDSKGIVAVIYRQMYSMLLDILLIIYRHCKIKKAGNI